MPFRRTDEDLQKVGQAAQELIASDSRFNVLNCHDCIIIFKGGERYLRITLETALHDLNKLKKEVGTKNGAKS